MIKIEVRSQKDINAAVAKIRMMGIDIIEMKEVHKNMHCGELQVTVSEEDEMYYRLSS